MAPIEEDNSLRQGRRAEVSLFARELRVSYYYGHNIDPIAAYLSVLALPDSLRFVYCSTRLCIGAYTETSISIFMYDSPSPFPQCA